MNRFIILFFLLLLSCKGFTQNYLDSLDQLTRVQNRDSLFYEKVVSFSRKTYRVYPDTTLHYVNQLMKPTQDTSLFRGVGLCYLRKSLIAWNKSKYDVALEMNDSALKYFKAIDFAAGVASIHNNNGLIHKDQRNYKLAIEDFLKSLSIKEQYADSVDLISTYNNLGLVYYHLQDYHLATNYYKRNLHIAIKSNLQRKQAVAYNNLGNIKIKQYLPGEALTYYLKADSSLPQGRDKYLRNTILGNIAIAYQDMGETRLAIPYFRKALSLANKLENADTKVLALRGLSKAHYQLDKDSLGDYYIEKAWGICDENDDFWTLAAISNDLFQHYKANGNYKKGLYYMEKFHEYYDSTHTIEKLKEIHRLKEQFESEQKARKIEILENENQLQKAILEKEKEAKARKQLQILVLIVIAGFLIVTILFLWFNYRLKVRTNRQLKSQYQTISEQQEEIRIQNEELSKSNTLKNKMFQIISHDLRSPLIALNDVARLIPYYVEENNQEELNKLSGTLTSSVSRLLALIDNLLSWSMSQYGSIPYHPENLNLSKVVSEVNDIYNNLAQIKQISLQNEVDADIQVFADRNLLMTVLRNLINNALKFTPENGEVKVNVQKTNGEVDVWVEDNGPGMTPEEIDQIFTLESNGNTKMHKNSGSGLGLFFCKEFVRINKGEIRIQSEKGKGTVVIFTLPASQPS